MIKEEKPKDQLTVYSANWVDVRDVATAHVECLTQEKAGGNRWIVAEGMIILTMILMIANIPNFQK